MSSNFIDDEIRIVQDNGCVFIKTKEWIKDVENKVKERFNQHV